MDAAEVADLNYFLREISKDLVAEALGRGMTHPQPSFFFLAKAMEDEVDEDGNPKTYRVGDVGELIGTTQQAAGKTLKVMEQYGYLTRSKDIDDTRAWCIELTSEGRTLIEIMEAVAERWGY